MIIIVMGVSGSGKTVVGRTLAERMGFDFLDADDLHPESNVEKMAAGVPLDDDDRRPWYRILNDRLRAAGDLVLSCSALKERYRQVLVSGVPGTRWVYLKVDFDTAEKRMARRRHFMPVALLRSQLETLEEPVEIPGLISVDAEPPVSEIVERIAPLLAPVGEV